MARILPAKTLQNATNQCYERNLWGEFSHNSPTATRSNGDRYTWKEPPRALHGHLSKAGPQPLECPPAPVPPFAAGWAPERLSCSVCRALGGVRTAQAEESNSCRVSDHLSTTTPSRCAGRNAETSTVPLNTHLFFRVNWPELLCKLLALNVQSRAVFSGCALIPK